LQAKPRADNATLTNTNRRPVSFVSREKDLLVLKLIRSGRYCVTSKGEIIAESTEDGRGKRQPSPVAQWSDSHGNLRVMLATGKKNPRQMLVYVNRVVGLAFLGDPGMPLQVIHRNGNKRDNRPRNLRWADAFEAMQGASQLGLLKPVQGAAHGAAKLTEREVREIKRRRAGGQTAASIMKEMKLDGRVTQWALYQIGRGDSWKHVA
jgi:HNH endonuclease